MGQTLPQFSQSPELNAGILNYELSPVHRRMAEMLSSGASREEIAAALAIHTSAVDKSFAKLRSQFQCKNNYQLIRFLADNHLL